MKVYSAFCLLFGVIQTTISSAVPFDSGPIGEKTSFGTTGPGGDYSFPRNTGIFSIEHLCGEDSPVYSLYPDQDNGSAGDKFYFDGDNNFCEPTNIRNANGWWGHGDTCIGSGVRRVWLYAKYSKDQTGCEPKREWSIPKTQECVDILYQLMDDCDTHTKHYKNGGLCKQHTSSGCMDWKMWATPS